MADRYGDLVRFRSWRNPIFFVNHPELVREVLVSRHQDFVRADAVRKALRIFDGDSILVTEGDQWREQRRLLQQGFGAERLRRYARIAAAYTREMLKSWPAEGPCRADHEMAQLCLNILSQVLLGTQPPSAVAEAIRVVLDARAVETGAAVFSVHRQAGLRMQPKKRALSQLHHFLDSIIPQRRAASSEHTDLLSTLVQACQRDNAQGRSQEDIDRQIRDETISMLNASLDATTAAMSWTLYLVARHPDVQQRLIQELAQIHPAGSDTALDHAALPFAEMVVHESLRLYPPNWVLITRHCPSGSTIGEQRIPPGSWLYIFPYVLHRDARWFAHPASFDPDRFAPEAFGPRQRSAYIPLGLGPHVCIGKALSTIILTSILATILREYRLQLLSDSLEIEVDTHVVMQPKNGVPLIVSRRRGGTSAEKT
jgi:cytochrome P450